MNIDVVPPDVNCSDVDFTVRDGKILFGLAAIKGCGGQAGQAIVAARKQGPFRSLFDFCSRVDPGSVNRTAHRKPGEGRRRSTRSAARRAQIMAAIDRALQTGSSALADRRSGQKGLFDEVEDESDAVAARRRFAGRSGMGQPHAPGE